MSNKQNCERNHTITVTVLQKNSQYLTHANASLILDTRTTFWYYERYIYTIEIVGIVTEEDLEWTNLEVGRVSD